MVGREGAEARTKRTAYKRRRKKKNNNNVAGATMVHDGRLAPSIGFQQKERICMHGTSLVFILCFYFTHSIRYIQPPLLHKTCMRANGIHIGSIEAFAISLASELSIDATKPSHLCSRHARTRLLERRLHELVGNEIFLPRTVVGGGGSGGGSGVRMRR